jgi:hypothetical protein
MKLKLQNAEDPTKIADRLLEKLKELIDKPELRLYN